MFKKVLVIMMVLGLVFTGQAMAKNYGNNSSASGLYEAQAWEKSFSIDFSGVNDYAKAGSNTMVGGTVDTFANAEGYHCEKVKVGEHWVWISKRLGWGYWKSDYEWQSIPNEASQEGSIIAIAFDGKERVESWDNGLTSFSSAQAELGSGIVTLYGKAKGENGLDEYVQTQAVFGGNLYQETLAQEVGYSFGSGIYAFQTSGLSFEASLPMSIDYDDDYAKLLSIYVIDNDSMAMGYSQVTIDPNKSIVGHAESMSAIEASRCLPATFDFSNVHGNGVVGGYISNGASFGGGVAEYSFLGYQNGSGQADLSAQIFNNTNSTTVIVNGSSSAVADGFVNVPR
jgi:hypothetical protein